MPTKLRQINKEIRTPLTPAQRNEYNFSLLCLLKQYDEMQAAMKIDRAKQKDELTSEAVKIRECRAALELGLLGKIECDELLDSDASQVIVVRTDTGEEVERRPATEEDRQQIIQFPQPD